MDLFDIGVRLSLTQNVGAGLRVISRDLLGIRGDIGKTQNALKSLSTTALGVGAVLGGKIVLDAWWDAAKAGDRIIQQQQRMISQGQTLAQVHQSYLAAVQGAATIEGTTVSGNLEALRNLYGTVGTYINAQAILPTVLKDAFVLRQQGQSDGDINAIYKMIDMTGMGVGANGQLDPAKFAHALDLVSATLNLVPHGLLSGTAMMQFARMMQPLAGLQGANPEQFFRDYTELMTQLGRTGGRGLAYFGLKMLGGQLSQAQVATLSRDGLLLPGAVGGTKEHPTLNPGGIVGYQELVQKGELAWFKDVLLPHIGVAWGSGESPENTAKVLRGLSGFPVTAQRAFATLLNLAPMMERFNEQLDRELPHLQDIFGDYQATLSAQLGDLGSAIESFVEVIGVPAAKTAIPVLQNLTYGVQQLTLFLGDHSWAPQLLDDTALALGALLTAVGTRIIAVGSLRALAFVLPGMTTALEGLAGAGILGTLARVAAFIPEIGIAAIALDKLISMLMDRLHIHFSATPSHHLNHAIGTHWGDVETPKPRGWAAVGPGGPGLLGLGGYAGLGVLTGSLPLPPTPPPPPPLPLPPIPPAHSLPLPPTPPNVTLTINPQVNVQGALLSTESAINEVLDDWWRAHASSEIIGVVRQALNAVQRHARRRTLQDNGDSSSVNLGSFPMGGL